MKTLQEAETLVGALPATSLPVALLPVQVQTRFVTRDGKPQLLVRVYPDELHLDGHEPALTAAEVAWGRRAWRLAWPKNKDKEAERLAWSQLAERFGRRRAEWIARKLRPTNLKQRPGTPPVFPAPGTRRDPDKVSPVLARRLPDRWVVMGYQGGQRVLLEVGSPIAKQLPVGPAFDDEPLPDVGPERIPLDAGMRWLVDFAAAEKVGMGIRIELPPGAANPTFDTLLVFGIRTSLAAPAAANELEALLDAQRYTRGLAFVPPGTPTNNTTESSSGLSLGDRDAGGRLRERSRVGEEGLRRGDRGPPAWGQRPRAGRARGRRPHGRSRCASAPDGAVAGHGRLLPRADHGGARRPARDVLPEQLEQARRHFLDYVRGLGPLPTLRAGRQPYGLLPAMSLDLFAEATGRGRFAQTLRFLRGLWKEALAGVPRLVAGGQDALVEILRVEPPRSATGRAWPWATSSSRRRPSSPARSARTCRTTRPCSASGSTERFRSGSCARNASSRSSRATVRSTSAGRSWRPAKCRPARRSTPTTSPSPHARASTT